MQIIWGFLAHGGLKLLILAFVLVGHMMKRNAEKAARDAQLPREMPNSMPPQEALPSQNMSSQQPNTAPKQKTLQSGSSSPWSSSSNPFDGKKK